MVIHEENKKSSRSIYLNVCSKKCAVFKHHVCELDQPQSVIVSSLQNMTSSDCENMQKKDKSTRKRVKKSPGSSSDSKGSIEVTHISPRDLEELRSVYKKCKAVVKKIETKYGHLLNLSESEPQNNSESDNNAESSKCECTGNKKIIFDDEGKEITAETDLDNHICPKKLKRRRSHVESNYSEPLNNLQVEYETPDLTLPEDLQSLRKILHDPDLEVTYRNKVIHKMRVIKQEYVDEIRFNKQSLIEKMKSNAEDMLDFKGTNLNSLPGYKC